VSVPLATTTVTFSQPASGGDPYEDAAVSIVASGVAAHFSAPTGNERTVGGQKQVVDMVLLCDPVDGVNHYCLATDDNTGDVWDVKWTQRRSGLGLDHLAAGVIAVKGASNG